MAQTKITFYRENTVNINLSFDGVDLTDATVYFTVKPQPDNDQTDAAAIIKKDITDHTDPVAGQTIIPLTPADTTVSAGNYVYDIKLKRSTGAQSTVIVGDCEIKEAVTLRA